MHAKKFPLNLLAGWLGTAAWMVVAHSTECAKGRRRVTFKRFAIKGGM